MSKSKGFGFIIGRNAMLVVLLLTMLFFEILLSYYHKGSLFSSQNLTNLIGQNGYVVILAVGMLLCILTGGNIDLAVGSIVMLVGAFAGIFIVNWKIDPYIGIIMALGVATLIGAWQAFWIAYVNIPPFIVTLSGMLAFKGLALFLLGGRNISNFPRKYIDFFNNYIPQSWLEAPKKDAFTSVELFEEAAVNYNNTILATSVGIAFVIIAILFATTIFSRLHKKRKGYNVENLGLTFLRLAVVSCVVVFVLWRLGQNKGIPMLLVFLGIIVLVYSYFTQNTVNGRYLYAMGGNAKAARLSGVNTKRMMFFAYTNMGFLAGVAALVCVARFGSASTQAGSGYELDAIGSCFIGGASAYGGIGTVGGAVIGAIFMGVLNMGMSLLGWDQNLQLVIKGLVLLAAVTFDVMSKKRKHATA